MPACVLLVRHGDTADDAGKVEVISALRPVPLNSDGRREALDLADELMQRNLIPDRIYSSPVERARMTARTIERKMRSPLVFDRRLMPWKAGSETGEPESRMQYWMAHDTEAPSQGETMTAFIRRFLPFVQQQLDEAERAGDCRLLVTHSLNLRAAEGWWVAGMRGDVDRKTFMAKATPAAGGGIVFKLRGGRWQLTPLDPGEG